MVLPERRILAELEALSGGNGGAARSISGGTFVIPIADAPNRRAMNDAVVLGGGFQKIGSALNQRNRFRGGMVVEPKPALDRARSLRQERHRDTALKKNTTPVENFSVENERNWCGNGVVREETEERLGGENFGVDWEM